MSDVLLIDADPRAFLDLAASASSDVLVIDDPQISGDQQVVVFDAAQTVSAGLAAASTDFVLLDTRPPPILATAAGSTDMLVITGDGPIGLTGPAGLIGPIGPTGLIGPIGPTGLAGPQGTFYIHTQDAASMQWDVYHLLGYTPNVTVVDSLGEVVYGDVQILGPDHLVIDFTSAFSGLAYLS